MLPNITRFGFLPKSSGMPASVRMGGFVLDMSEVMRNMERLNIAVMPARIRIGLAAAGGKFMTDTVTGIPSVPIKRPDYTDADRKAGELRASGALFVDGVKKGTTVKHGEGATGMYQPDSYGGTPIVPMSHEACVVFNAPYAAKQHESFEKKTQPGAGRYFMSEKLYGNAIQYMSILAKEIRL